MSYYNIICGLLGKVDFMKEEDTPDFKAEQVKNLVNELKKVLADYWDI